MWWRNSHMTVTGGAYVYIYSRGGEGGGGGSQFHKYMLKQLFCFLSVCLEHNDLFTTKPL